MKGEPVESERLRGELSRCRAQLAALESVLSTNEHLVLKAPLLRVFDWNRPVPWGEAPMIERWEARLELRRWAETGAFAGHMVADYFEVYSQRVDVFGAPRLLLAALPPPRRT